jgi:serine/threonine-protein kinase
MFPAPEFVLAAKYRLIRQLGQGGMGSVWLAEHLSLRSPVAIKLIEPSIATNPEALARFLREAQAAASLRSPHVVQILDHGVDAGVPFIAMELLEGESLANRLLRVGRLAPAETAKLMTQVARAMARAHEAGIVHRDLKPDNIFIVHNDEDELAKVLDFGVAKSSVHALGLGVSSGTRTGAMLGTPYYMSPEQAEGRLVDARSDIWAMGVIAWECLLGTRPFDADSLGTLLLGICAHPLPVPSRVGAVPPGFDAWFARTCARDPAQRFQAVKEAANELRRVCGDVMSATPLGAPSTLGYAAVSRTAAPPLVGTTANLGVSSPAVVIPKTKLSGVLVAAVLLLGLVAVGIGGTLLVLRGRASTVPATSAAVGESLPAPAGVPVASASSVPVPTLTPEPAVAPAPTPSTQAGKPSAPPPNKPIANVPVPAAPTVAASPAAEKSKPASTPAPAVAPPVPAAAPPAAKPNVNLGI